MRKLPLFFILVLILGLDVPGTYADTTIKIARRRTTRLRGGTRRSRRGGSQKRIQSQLGTLKKSGERKGATIKKSEDQEEPNRRFWGEKAVSKSGWQKHEIAKIKTQEDTHTTKWN